MKKLITLMAVAQVLLSSALCFGKDNKTYKHVSRYQVATLDQNLRVETGSDVTLARTQTDAKLEERGQGIHLLFTAQGNYRVEAPINKGLSTISIISSLSAESYHPAQTFHNKWFLDNVQSGTKVLFASGCAKPSRKHPNDAVVCTFWFPDPDSTDHEYATRGDFTPYLNGDGSNLQKTADTLCGTGKLNAEVEALLCTRPAATILQPAKVSSELAPAQGVSTAQDVTAEHISTSRE